MVFGVSICSSKPACALSACDVDKVRNRSLLEKMVLGSLGHWLFMTAALGNLLPSFLKCNMIYNSIGSDAELIKLRRSRKGVK